MGFKSRKKYINAFDFKAREIDDDKWLCVVCQGEGSLEFLDCFRCDGKGWIPRNERTQFLKNRGQNKTDNS